MDNEWEADYILLMLMEADQTLVQGYCTTNGL